MTYVQFYILASDKVEDRWHYTEQLVLQSLRSGKAVYVHTACSTDTRALMQLLVNRGDGNTALSLSGSTARSTDKNDSVDADELVFIDHKLSLIHI